MDPAVVVVGRITSSGRVRLLPRLKRLKLLNDVLRAQLLWSPKFVHGVVPVRGL